MIYKKIHRKIILVNDIGYKKQQKEKSLWVCVYLIIIKITLKFIFN